MEKSDKVYRFRSRNQHILTVSWQGRKYKVKFTTPYSGVSRYSTSYETLAQKIRDSWQFKSGQIVEDEPLVQQVAKPVKQATKEFEPETEKVDEIPAWMKQSVKVNKNGNGNGNQAAAEPQPAPTDGGQAADAAGIETTADAEGTTAETEAETPAESEGTTAGPMEQVMFGIKIEEVETYMDAKQYVRDVLGVDVTKKEEVKAYCQENGIVFPNFQFE